MDYGSLVKTLQELKEVIAVDPETMSGTPVFAGTRVPVQTLFEYLESGDDLAEFLEDFPSVTQTLALRVLELSKDSLLENAALSCA
jgi:uncharacterized protein (DUF433 family)